MDPLITPADCHTALKNWRSPRKLASCHIAGQILSSDQFFQSIIDDQRVTRITERARIVQAFLRNGLDQVTHIDVGRVLPTKSIESLVIYQRFIVCI